MTQNLEDKLRRFAVSAITVSGIFLAAAGCSGGNKIQEVTPTPYSTIAPTSTAAPTSTPTIEATATPKISYLAPTANIPEANRTYLGEVSSLSDVLDIYNSKDIQYGQNMSLMLLKEGTEILAPFSGNYGSIAQGKYNTVTIILDNNPNRFIGILFPGIVSEGITAGGPVTKGDIIGTVGEGRVINVEVEANLLIKKIQILPNPSGPEYQDIFINEAGQIYY